MSDKCNSPKISPVPVDEAAASMPGVAVDIADDEKVTPSAVKQYTKELNNNPRNHEKNQDKS
ncbi:MAG: hypothetical protein NC117_06840 [Pseudoflavonifractor sp.]|nr:hypothetical protein [Pseudoflavonifractor sp.]